MSNIPYIIKPDSVTLFINGKGLTVASDHINFKKIVDELQQGNTDGAMFMSLINVAKSLGATTMTEDSVDVSSTDIVFNKTSGKLTYKGYPLSGFVATKAMELYKLGQPRPLAQFLAFLENLYKNPRNTIAERLYRFLEVGNMPITEDGCFLAYKKIRGNWKDIHSDTMENKVGTTVEMPRVLVNDKDTETCSTGLHFCSYAYLKNFSSSGSTDRIVVLKINPADVVSIPTDYNDTKGRACKYVVLSEITSEAKQGPVLEGKPVVRADAFVVKPVSVPTPIVGVDVGLAARLNLLSNKQLVSVYNKLTNSNLDHFRDKATGIKRLIDFDDASAVMKLVSGM